MSDRRDEFLERLAARHKAREAAKGSESVKDLCARIRAWYYPKQAGFLRSEAKRRATLKTRRSGATTGGCRELLARALEQPGFRATYCNETRDEARKLAWKSDTKGGLVDLIESHGKKQERKIGVPHFELGGVIVEVREQDLTLNFANGSTIDFFCADDEHALEKMRGRAKHVVWVDEAQKFRNLDTFVLAIIAASMTDFDGETWLTGTPSKDTSGYFYRVTGDDRAPGWEVHEIAVTDNPWFGDTAEERWARTAAKALTDNAWTVEEPDFQREWMGKWVHTDALYVYPIHSVPSHSLFYAPMRLDSSGFPDILRAMEDLPRLKGRAEYFLGMGADLGTTRPFGLTVVAWSLHDPWLYELASWKRAGLDYDEMAAYLHAIQRQRFCGLVVADAGGGGKPAVKGWSKKWVERYGLPIIEADKSNNELAIKQIGNDIRHDHLRMREGSPLVEEWKKHRWLKTRSATGLLVEDPTTPHDLSDAYRYIHRESYHHRFRPVDPPPKPGTSAYALREEAQIEEDSYSAEENSYH